MVIVKGRMIKLLIYSGSQVSILPVSFFNKLKDTRVNRKLPMIPIRGGNDGVIPYIGYFETNLLVEDKIINNVGFLLVDNDKISIIGMNIIGELRNETIDRS